MTAHRYPRQLDHKIFDVIRSKTPELVAEIAPSDLERISRGAQHTRLLLERGVHSWMAVPILLDGRVGGTIECYRAQTLGSFGPDDLVAAQALAERVAPLLARGWAGS
jgi:GAF domain-containing protein